MSIFDYANKKCENCEFWRGDSRNSQYAERPYRTDSKGHTVFATRLVAQCVAEMEGADNAPFVENVNGDDTAYIFRPADACCEAHRFADWHQRELEEERELYANLERDRLRDLGARV